MMIKMHAVPARSKEETETKRTKLSAMYTRPALEIIAHETTSVRNSQRMKLDRAAISERLQVEIVESMYDIIAIARQRSRPGLPVPVGFLNGPRRRQPTLHPWTNQADENIYFYL